MRVHRTAPHNCESKLQDELKTLISGKDTAGLEAWLKEERAKAKA